MPDFLPRGNESLSLWSLSFARNLVRSPEAVGVDPESAAACLASAEAFAATLQRANQPSTRGPSSTQRKNTLRDELKRNLRAVCKRVRGYPATTATQLVDLGLRPMKTTKTRIGKPETAPTITVLGVRGATITIQLRDPATPTRTGLPWGVRAALVYACHGDQPPAESSDWRYIGATTRARFEVAFDNLHPAGTKVWLAAQWESTRMKRGPMSARAYAIIHYPEEMPATGRRALCGPGTPCGAGRAA